MFENIHFKESFNLLDLNNNCFSGDETDHTRTGKQSSSSALSRSAVSATVHR